MSIELADVFVDNKVLKLLAWRHTNDHLFRGVKEDARRTKRDLEKTGDSADRGILPPVQKSPIWARSSRGRIFPGLGRERHHWPRRMWEVRGDQSRPASWELETGHRRTTILGRHPAAGRSPESDGDPFSRNKVKKGCQQNRALRGPAFFI